MNYLKGLGYEVADYGCYSTDAVDYPDIALLVAQTFAWYTN
jgi:ribose 5-phosphate isomerase B